MSEQLTLREATVLAHELMEQYLSDAWSFTFDNAKRRAGQCRYREKSISVSKYFVQAASREEFRQVMLHEIAHAVAGPGAGHGPQWKTTARRLGYTGKRTLEKEFAANQAAWIGTCPSGHTVRRFRKPQKPTSCSRCARTYDSRYGFAWRFIPQELRGSAAPH